MHIISLEARRKSQTDIRGSDSGLVLQTIQALRALKHHFTCTARYGAPECPRCLTGTPQLLVFLLYIATR